MSVAHQQIAGLQLCEIELPNAVTQGCAPGWIKPRRVGVEAGAGRDVAGRQGQTRMGHAVGEPAVPHLAVVQVHIAWLKVGCADKGHAVAQQQRLQRAAIRQGALLCLQSSRAFGVVQAAVGPHRGERNPAGEDRRVTGYHVLVAMPAGHAGAGLLAQEAEMQRPQTPPTRGFSH